MSRKDGVITIYLSLIIGIILALIVTTIEGARIGTAKTFINRVLETSMKSTLCDYYLPMYEKYHIFGLHLEGQSIEEQQAFLVDKIEQRALDNLAPAQSKLEFSYILNGTRDSFLMCNPTLQDITLSNEIFLTDQEGRFMRNQALAYTKYSVPMDLLEKLLDAVGFIEDAKVANSTISKKMKIEKELAAIDQRTLRLMELIDGVDTEEIGFKQSTFFRKLYSTDFFVKKLVADFPTQRSVEVNHADVFDALEDSYLIVPEIYNGLISFGADIYENVHSVTGDADWDDALEEVIKQYKTSDDESLRIFSNVNGKITEALEIINQIEQLRQTAAEHFSSYQDELEANQEELGNLLYTELSSNNESIMAYTDLASNQVGLINDIKQMKETLLHNQEVLSKAINYEHVPFSVKDKEYQAWVANVLDLKNIMSSYSIAGLSFDYSEIEFDTLDFSIFSILKGIICSGIFESVIGSKAEISKAELTGIGLPSHHPKGLNVGEVAKTEDEIREMYLEIGGLEFGNMGIAADDTSKAAFDIGESILFLGYINEHTTNFTSEDYDVGQVLNYEQEYLLFGSLKDKRNLEKFATRMVMIRTALNMISVLSDNEKTSKAMKTAEIMSCTGLPFLVTMTKYLILFYWAYCEAVVEVAALFKNKEIPIYTTKEDFVVSYADLIGLSESKINNMTEKYEAKTFIKLNYSEYLLLNLYFVEEQDKTYRMMDLIQENLRYEYEDSFRMRKCIFSFSCEANSTMNEKFLFLPYFQRNNIAIGGYQLHSKLSVTY